MIEPMTVEKAKKYLSDFSKLDYTKDKNRYKLLEQFVNKVFVYDEYCVVIYNGTNSVGEEFDLNDAEIKSHLNFGNKKTESEILFGFGSLGSPGRARTYDLPVNSRMLYH
jgi:hypothetical protein